MAEVEFDFQNYKKEGLGNEEDIIGEFFVDSVDVVYNSNQLCWEPLAT